jgi:RecA-family ATPase
LGQLWDPPSVGEYLNSVAVVPTWLLEGILPADSVAIMSGKAKRAYKSWLAFRMAICVATGKTAGPMKPIDERGVPTLILEAEGGKAQTRNRWLWLGRSAGIEDWSKVDNLRFSHRENIVLDDPSHGWIDRVDACIKRRGIKFLIVDPLAMFFSGDENKVQDVAKIMRAFTSFRQNGATVLFLHHLTKTDPRFTRDVDEELRGSSALPGFYDTHFAIRKSKDTQEHLDLIIRSKDEEEQYYELHWYIDKRQGKADFTMMTATKQGTFSKFAEDVTTHMIPGVEYSRNRLMEISELDEGTAKALLDWMVEQGLIEHGAKGVKLSKEKTGAG